MPPSPATDSDRPIIALEDYCVRYGKKVAVDHASFEMPKGACGLLGKNGAGKSSILKTVLGLLRPHSGRATVLGYDARKRSLELRDHVGYMPEKEAWLPGLSGLDAVILSGILSGLPRVVAKQRAHEVLYLSRIEEERYRSIATYSTGMKQKVKLATALVHDPQLLFLDEPTNGLDPQGRSEILSLFQDLVINKGKSLILSSHILSDVEELCDYLVLIDEGRVVQQGRLQDLTAHASRSFELQISSAHERYLAELSQKGIHAALLESGSLYVELGQGEEPALLFELARSLGAQVRKLLPQRRSLSDVFLGAIPKDVH